MSTEEQILPSCEDVRASVYHSLSEYILKPKGMHGWRAEAERTVSEAIGRTKLVAMALEGLIEEDAVKEGPDGDKAHLFGESTIGFAIDPSERKADALFDDAVYKMLDEIPGIKKDTADPEATSWSLLRETSDPKVQLEVIVYRSTGMVRYDDDAVARNFERARYTLAFDYEDQNS